MSKDVSSLKKAYCPYCRSENELDHIFSVNPDADVCYCPNCMRELKPKNAIDDYNYFISLKLGTADRLLYRDTKFYDAYCEYGHVLEIDSTVTRTRFGRILALTYMSKLRKTNFAQASLLLETDAEQHFRKMKDQNHYVKFLTKMNNALDEYYTRLNKKITFKERYLGEEFVDLYFTRLYEIVKAKKVILNEFNKSYTKTEDEKTNRLIKELDKDILSLEKMMKATLVSVDGSQYKVQTIVNNKHILIEKLFDQLPALNHYPKRKLEDSDKKGRIMKDLVYPDNSHIIALIRGSLPLFIFFFLSSAASIVYHFITKSRLKILLIVGGGALLLAGIITLILYIVWKSQLSKRRHLID